PTEVAESLTERRPNRFARLAGLRREHSDLGYRCRRLGLDGEGRGKNTSQRGQQETAAVDKVLLSSVSRNASHSRAAQDTSRACRAVICRGGSASPGIVPNRPSADRSVARLSQDRSLLQAHVRLQGRLWRPVGGRVSGSSPSGPYDQNP